MSENGLLDLLPAAPGASVWTIAPTDEEAGVLIDLARAQRADDFPNVACADGAGSNAEQIVGRAYVEGGPLAFGGPHGRIPTFKSDNLLTTQTAADSAAAAYLASTLAQQRTVIPVTCLPHPGLQVHDAVELEAAIGTMPGVVQTQTLSGDGNGVKPMTLGVSVSAEQLAIIAGARRGV